MIGRMFILGCTTILASCAVFQPPAPEDWVTQRAEAQAQALIARDYDVARSYTTPAYQQSERSKYYAANFSGSSFWQRAEVAWVRCGGEPNPTRCEVRLWVYGQFPRAGAYASQRGDDVPASLDSVWIKIDNNWYQYLD